MKAVAVRPAARTVELVDHPEPAIETATQVTLRVLEVGICGTDKEICAFKYGTPPAGTDHLVIGHESLGEVVEVGPAVTDVRAGDLVVPMVRRPCSARRPAGACPAGPSGLLLHRRLHRARHQGAPRLHDRVGRRRRALHERRAARAARRRRAGRAAHDRREGAGAAVRGPAAPAVGVSDAAAEGPRPLPSRARPRRRAGRTARRHGARARAASRPSSTRGARGRTARRGSCATSARRFVSRPRRIASPTCARGSARSTSSTRRPACRARVRDAGRCSARTASSSSPACPGRRAPSDVDTDGLMRNLVLQNQVVLGSVNASRDDFEAAIRDLARLPTPLAARRSRALITGRFPIDALPRAAARRPPTRIKSSLLRARRIAWTTREWLEADGLGGFASGTVCGVRTRRYHALLLAGDDAADRARRARERLRRLGRDAGGPLRAHRRSATRRDVVHPDGARAHRVASRAEPWPRWTFALDGRHARRAGARSCAHGRAAPSLLAWRLLARRRPGVALARAAVPLRPRLPRAAPREPGASASTPTSTATRVALAAVRRRAGGRRAARTARYAHEPDWYRNFLYAEERARGLDCVEDLASPGVLPLRPRARARPCWSLAADGDERRRRRDARRGRRAARASASARAAPRFASPLAARGRRVPRARAATGRTIVAGYPVVHRLGPRHVHRAARALPRDRPARRGARRSCSSGPGAVSRGHAAEPLPRSRRARPSSTRSTPSLWFVVAVHELPRARAAARRRVAARRARARCATAVDAILDGLRARHALRHPRRRRRPARRRRARRAAHLDGREGRRLGGHAAHRQAGRDPGAVAQRAAHRRRAARDALARARSSAARDAFARALLERRRAAASTTSSTSITCRARVDATLPAEPDLRGRRPAVRRCSTGERARAVVDAVERAAAGRRSACARSPRTSPPTSRATKGASPSATAPTTRARSGRGSSARSSRPGCACAARPPRRRPRRAGASSTRCCAIWRTRASATSPRSPTATRRTRRAAARSRPGRWARCCGSTAWSSVPDAAGCACGRRALYQSVRSVLT